MFAVLPEQAKKRWLDSEGFHLVVGRRPITVEWIGEGRLGDARRFLSESSRSADLVAAKRLSPGARAALTENKVSWVDETGAAEIDLESLIISRMGYPTKKRVSRDWTPAVLAVAESLLCGVDATVAQTVAATELSAGSCSIALRKLVGLGLLEADAERGRNSGRRVRNMRTLLDHYAVEAAAHVPEESLQIGVLWRDPIEGIREASEHWREFKIEWCATGILASNVMAPMLTHSRTAEVYIDTKGVSGLYAAANCAHLEPLEGGRLTLRPMPTKGTKKLIQTIDGLKLAPWPRIYVDLLSAGVRGEEIAEHLLEKLNVT